MSSRFPCGHTYWADWETRVRCGQPPHHRGAHGPAPKPALAVESSETSKAAARAIEPARGNLRERVYAALLTPGGLTDEEGIEATGLDPSTYRPRRIELWEAQRVVKTLLTRSTKSGRQAAVYEAVR